jgi:hypothetical protein
MYRDRFSPKAMFWQQEYPKVTHFLRLCGLDPVPGSYHDAVAYLERWGTKRAASAEEMYKRSLETGSDPRDLPLLYSQLRSAMMSEKKVNQDDKGVLSTHQRLEIASECLDHLGKTKHA